MKRILIIEDDPNIIEIYRTKLQAEGFTISSAVTADEGLNKLKQEEIDLVVLDIMLPGGKNGFDVLAEIKKDPKLKVIPVIILTNLESESTSAKLIGAYDYLIKSNTPLEEVVKKIKQAVK